MLERSLRKSAIIFAAVLLVMALAACGKKDDASGKDGKRVIKIGYLPITHAVPLYMQTALQKEEGFEDFELELVKFGSWPDLSDALNTGQIDGASMLVTLAMRAKEQGIDLKAVALGHRDGNVLIVSQDIQSTADLKGKNFAIPHKFSTHNILLYQTLEKDGMSYSDVHPVEMPPAEMSAALAEKRIAGYVVAEPFGAMSVTMGHGKVLYQSEEIWPDSVDCALVLRGDFIRKEPEIVQSFVNEYLRAGKIAEAKDEHTLEVSQEFMDVSDETMQLSFQWIVYDNLRLNEEAYNTLTEYLVKMGLSENPPKYEEFVDNTFIDNAE